MKIINTNDKIKKILHYLENALELGLSIFFGVKYGAEWFFVSFFIILTLNLKLARYSRK